MEDEILELKEEIKFLEKRIDVLERSNNNRKAGIYLKMIIKICAILLVIFGLWRGYEYATREIPKLIEDKVKEINPSKIINQ